MSSRVLTALCEQQPPAGQIPMVHHVRASFRRRPWFQVHRRRASSELEFQVLNGPEGQKYLRVGESCFRLPGQHEEAARASLAHWELTASPGAEGAVKLVFCHRNGAQIEFQI